MTIEIVEFFQNLQNGFFDLFFNFISFLGEEYVYIVFLVVVYYGFDKKLGELLGYSLIVSASMNSILKNTFKTQRPFEKYPERIVNLRDHTSSGYSFPSGHTQSFTSVAASFMYYVKKRYVTIIMITLSVLMAISRMYLGVHFFEDVFVSLILGFGLAYGYYRFFVKYGDDQEVMMKMYIGTAVILLIFIFIYPTKDYITSVGMFIGFFAAMWFEKNYVNFEMASLLRHKIIRIVIGLVVMLSLQIGLKVVFQVIASTENMQLFFDFLRYFLLVFIGLGYLPKSFKKMGI